MPPHTADDAAIAVIDEAIAAFDGTGVEPLREVAGKAEASPAVIDHLINVGFGNEQNPQIAATWLLKHYLDQGFALTDAQNRAIADSLNRLTDWQAQLHLAQSFGRLRCTDEQAAKVVEVLKAWFQSDRKFLRAWACDALWQLGKHHEGVRDTAFATLLAAEADPAASVRARARNLLKMK
ncbi:MAG: hypothetical protein AAFX92_16760 [Pseudomonadota bacterium]